MCSRDDAATESGVERGTLGFGGETYSPIREGLEESGCSSNGVVGARLSSGRWWLSDEMIDEITWSG